MSERPPDDDPRDGDGRGDQAGEELPTEVPAPSPEPAEATVAAELEAAAERDAEERKVDVAASPAERFIAAITGTSVITTVLAFVSAMVIGAVIIAVSEESVRSAMGYFFSRPSDTFAAGWAAASAAYGALFRGAIGGLRQLSETGVAATPLILTGLAVALPLRAGLFNIGAEGQLIAGGLIGGLVGFGLVGLPLIVHLPLAVLAAVAGGTLYGWLPGILKARTGAHEVITTIMLNNIAIFVTEYLLSTDVFRQPGRTDPISKAIQGSAQLPRFTSGMRLHVGLLVALAVAVLIWYLMERSSTGFQITAVGLNPNAATYAGMSVGRMVVLAMAVAGGLAGLAGGTQILGVNYRITGGFSGGLGFEGITVALLGRGTVGGTVAAGALFGALRAGGRAMQAQTGTSLDLITVLQALIIVFVAAPALVRAIYRIRTEATVTGQVAKGWGA